MKAVFMLSRAHAGLSRMAEDFPDVIFAQANSPDELAAALTGADILITSNRIYTPEVAAIVRANGKRLRWIQFSTSGLDKAIRSGLPPGIPVSNASGVRGRTVAEHAMTLLLSLFRRMREVERARNKRTWIRDEITPKIRSAEGATLVIVGLGAVGRELARKAKAFDMHVIAVTRQGKPGEAVDETVPRGRFAEALARADSVAMCVPLGPETRHFLGAKELSRMKPGAFVINVCRGEVIDEEALIAALKEGRIAGAGLDVARTEPLPEDHPLWRMDNVVISPHIAGAGGDGGERFVEIFSDKLRRFRAGEPLNKLIDWEKSLAEARD